MSMVRRFAVAGLDDAALADPPGGRDARPGRWMGHGQEKHWPGTDGPRQEEVPGYAAVVSLKY